MGQPKFPKKAFETPNHPWQGERIKEEHEIRRKFGLKNKTEIWKAQTRLRDIRGQARTLISRGRNPDDTQAHQESKLLRARLHREGLIAADATLNEVLGLDVERILNRRLQSQVYLKGMARTPKQARQFVSHGLIQIGRRRVTVPSYLVRREEEEQITFTTGAAVADPAHPVRPKAPGQEPVDAPAKEPEAEAPAEPKQDGPAAPPAAAKETEAKEAEPKDAPEAAKSADAKEAPEPAKEAESKDAPEAKDAEAKDAPEPAKEAESKDAPEPAKEAESKDAPEAKDAQAKEGEQ